MAVKQVAVGQPPAPDLHQQPDRATSLPTSCPTCTSSSQFLQMRKQIICPSAADRGPGLGPPRDSDRDIRPRAPALVKDLSPNRTPSPGDSSTELFLESLLRRSHFEKGRYDLLAQLAGSKARSGAAARTLPPPSWTVASRSASPRTASTRTSLERPRAQRPGAPPTCSPMRFQHTRPVLVPGSRARKNCCSTAESLPDGLRPAARESGSFVSTHRARNPSE